MHRYLISTLGALLLAASGIASAQNAYTAKPMNLRAGPNRDYPLVAQLDAGAPLDVHGCLDGYAWCDVSFEDTRGWMYAGGISFVYNGDRVPLYSYGPRLGLPVITFSLGAYWGSYYRSRPFYAQRDTWAHRHFPAPARAPNRGRAGPPPMSRGRPAVSSRPEEQEHSSESGRMERQPQRAPATQREPMQHQPMQQHRPMEHAPTQQAPSARQKGPPQNSRTKATHGREHPKNPP